MLGALLLAITGVFGFGSSGTPALALLRTGPGPRAAAMGEAWIALADDATALHWNPAGLGQVADYRLAAQHHEWFAGIRDELIQLGFPAGAGALALQLLYSGERDIEYWNEHNQPGGTFSTWTALAGLGYGGTIAGRWHVGLGLKGVLQDLHTSTGYGGGLDVGLLGRPLDFLSVGVAGRNLGLVRYPGAWEELPAEVGVGLRGRWRGLTATLDGVLPLGNSLECRAGVEYRPVPLLAVRAGYRTGPADIGSLGWTSGITAGLGITAAGLGIDYAVAPAGRLGIVHRLGIEARIARRGGGVVTIKTVDRQTMQPLRAQVVLEGVARLSTGTDRYGKLVLTRLWPGRLIIRTAAAGYHPRIDTLQVIGDREQFATLALAPLQYGSVWGTIYDAASNQPIGGTIIYRGPVYGEQQVPGNSGSFALRELPEGSYRLRATGPTEDYIPQACSVDVPAGGVVERSFLLVRQHQTIALQGINFATGKADIQPGFTQVLDVAGAILKQNSGIAVEIAGHTDPREISTPEFPSNRELSQARAEAVKQYLVHRHGIAENRLTARGYADTRPVADNMSEDGMAKNRRVEFRVLRD